jgi:prophage regulatory protein
MAYSRTPLRSSEAGGTAFSKKILSYADLKPRKGIPYSRVHLARLIKAGKFPAPVKLSDNRVGFVEGEIDNLVEALMAARDGEAP